MSFICFVLAAYIQYTTILYCTSLLDVKPYSVGRNYIEGTKLLGAYAYELSRL